MKHLFAPLCCAALFCAAGCGPTPTYQSGVKSPEEYMRDWHDLAAEPPGKMDEGSAKMIAGKLAAVEGGLDMLFEVLADPESRPEAKLLAVVSLQPQLSLSLEPRIDQLTEPGLDPTTRACATQLLAFLRSEFSLNKLRTLLDDANHQVKMAALLGLLEAGKDDVFDHAEALWHADAARGQDRTAMILALPDTYAQTHLADYAAALADDIEIAPHARMIAAGALARSQDRQWLGALAKAAESDPDAQVREVSTQAKIVIEERATEELATDAEEQ